MRNAGYGLEMVMGEGEKERSESFLLAKGGGLNEHTQLMREAYSFPDLLKQRRELAITAGWCRAVTEGQALLQRGELRLPR